uniref:Uncharacterized protein n=1 Tax=Arundo donax TaxID=35708 RepID=A0A0A9GC41_ARUDO
MHVTPYTITHFMDSSSSSSKVINLLQDSLQKIIPFRMQKKALNLDNVN